MPLDNDDEQEAWPAWWKIAIPLLILSGWLGWTWQMTEPQPASRAVQDWELPPPTNATPVADWPSPQPPAALVASVERSRGPRWLQENLGAYAACKSWNVLNWTRCEGSCVYYGCANAK